MCLFELWFSQGIHPGVVLLGHMVVLFLVFLKFPPLFIVAVPIYIPTRGFPFSASSLEFIVCKFFDDSKQCEVMPLCHFDLHFSNN